MWIFILDCPKGRGGDGQSQRATNDVNFRHFQSTDRGPINSINGISGIIYQFEILFARVIVLEGMIDSANLAVKVRHLSHHELARRMCTEGGGDIRIFEQSSSLS